MDSCDLPLECSFLDFSIDSDDESPTSSVEDDIVDNHMFSSKFIPFVRTQYQFMYHTKLPSFNSLDEQTLTLADIRIQPGESGSWLARPEHRLSRRKHRPQNLMKLHLSSNDKVSSPRERNSRKLPRIYQQRVNQIDFSPDIVPHSAPILSSTVEREKIHTDRRLSQMAFAQDSPAPIYQPKFSIPCKGKLLLSRSLPASLNALLAKGKTKIGRSKRFSYSSENSLRASCTEYIEKPIPRNSSFVLVIDQPKTETCSVASEPRFSIAEKESMTFKDSADLSTVSDTNTDYKDVEEFSSNSSTFQKEVKKTQSQSQSQIIVMNPEMSTNETVKKELVLNWITHNSNDGQSK
ncbi:hypothetical protein PPACK8108_LOCUS5593 [Phakopsora pachyrhizi]|uniref:Uncharacterized protein n=1 Tax=Phakopsora pachyrhizi TaxID=170000 RepID=A0AAV0APC6_PHAPC|nr:hypothetical protein PPACK8108_LOCUS5593 [Phakopsora pachyrhizi]